MNTDRHLIKVFKVGKLVQLLYCEANMIAMSLENNDDPLEVWSEDADNKYWNPTWLRLGNANVSY